MVNTIPNSSINSLVEEEVVVLANHKVVGNSVVDPALSFSCVLSKPIHLHSSENKTLIREIKVKS